MKHLLSSALVGVLLFAAACASDPSSPDPKDDDGDPGPVVLEDGQVFRVFSIEMGGKAPRLRWVGDATGPFAESPEQTTEPWIGFGRPFRIEWEITSETGRVTGYQYRFDHQESAPFYPRSGGEAVYSDIRTLGFDSQLPADTVEVSCFNDPDCFRTIRLPSDRYPLEIRAIDDSGRERSEPDFQIWFNINYAPSASFQEDSVAGCDEPEHFPRYEFLAALGPSADCALLRDDTIPAGSKVSIRLDGLDRYDATDFPDDACCDEPGDDGEQPVRFQAQLEITAENDRGGYEEWLTFFSLPSDDPLLSFTTGPFDYVIVGKTVDEHERRSEGVGYFSFRSGFDPEIVDVSPADGARIYLRDPLVEGAWPQNDVPYTSEFHSRYWDPDAQRLLDFAGGGRVGVAGHVFHIPLSFQGQASPDEPTPLYVNSTIQGGVMAWAYEWIGEFDPENDVQEGPGFDDLGDFSRSDQTDLSVSEAGVEIWVPLNFWSDPAVYLDSPAPGSKEAWIVEDLRRRMGVVDFLVRGRSTWAAQVDRCPPMSEEQQSGPDAELSCLPEQPLSSVGRYTATTSHRLELRLGLDPGETGSLTELWPASSAKQPVEPTRSDILRRIRTPREKG